MALKFFGHSAFKIELLALQSEASTERKLSNRCLLLVEYKQFQKRRTKGFTHCTLATDNSVSHLSMGNKNFQSIIRLGFHHILCNNPRGGHSIVKNTGEREGKGAGSIVWGLGFWLRKDILEFFKNIDMDNS